MLNEDLAKEYGICGLKSCPHPKAEAGGICNGYFHSIASNFAEL